MPPRFIQASSADSPSGTWAPQDRETLQNSGKPMARYISEKMPRLSHSYLNDTLGKHVVSAIELLRSSPSWESFVQAYRGPSLLSEAVRYLPHPAASLLHSIRSRGVPVTMADGEWSAEKIQDMARRGPHKSAITPSSSVKKWPALPSKAFGSCYRCTKWQTGSAFVFPPWESSPNATVVPALSTTSRSVG
jgi:hypothetical protein